MERRSFSDNAFDLDVAAQQVDEAPYDVEPQPHPGRLSRGQTHLVEHSENVLQLIGGDPDAGIADAELDVTSFRGFGTDFDVAGICEFERVRDQITQHDLEFVGIREGGQGMGYLPVDADIFFAG